MVGDRPRDGGGPSRGWRLTVLRMGGDCPGDRNTYGLGYSYLIFIYKIWDKQTEKQTNRQTNRQTDRHDHV